MSFFKNLFGGDKKSQKKEAQPLMRGSEPLQSTEQIDSTRNTMEAEMQADRVRRQAQADAKEAPKKDAAE